MRLLFSVQFLCLAASLFAVGSPAQDKASERVPRSPSLDSPSQKSEVASDGKESDGKEMVKLLVELAPGDPQSKLAPRYSPKGRQFQLTASARTDVAGLSPLETKLPLGPNPGDGVMAVFTRSEEGKPYDRLAIDLDQNGELNEPAISCEPKLVRGSTWSSFEATLQINHAPPGVEPSLSPYPISLWIVVEDPKDSPELVRISRRGFLTGEVKQGETTYHVVVSDSNNDGVLEAGDWWELRSAEPIKDSGMREIGDFSWADGKAWRITLQSPSGSSALLSQIDPGLSQEEDLKIRDRLREDRMATRAPQPIAFRKDVDVALAEAAEKGMPYFIKFETEWCGPCKTMAELVFTAKKVVDAAEGTLCIVVDGDHRKELAEKHQVKGYPTGILFGADGKEIARYSGYQSVKETAAFFSRKP